MQLLFLDTLKEISGYVDKRSVQTWLSEMNLSLIRIGKNYAVDRESFEKALMKKYRITKKKTRYQSKQKTEKEFLNGLDLLLSKPTEVSSHRHEKA